VKRGAITFVLHSHIPYVRRAGRWPHGEEILYEAMAETYIPLLNALFELKDEGIEPRLTLGLTPILLEQLADKDVCDHFERYLEERLALAESDIRLDGTKHDGRRQSLARWYHNWYTMVLTSFRERYYRDLVGAFRALWADGNLDILTGAATHGYLPLLGRDSSIYGQLKIGLDTSRVHFGRAPTGIWLPECGYRPASQQRLRSRPGLEAFLRDLHLGYFFTDTDVITGGKLVSSVAGDLVGPYGGGPVQPPIRPNDAHPQSPMRTTMRPYYVAAANVAVFGRDACTSTQVWSTWSGYPGHVVYREFHRQEANSGLRYWRITDAKADPGSKDWYDPQRAFQRASVDAAHFVGLVEKLVTNFAAQHSTAGIVVSAYDAELFGHWWFEGVVWFKEVHRLLARSEIVEAMTADAYLHIHPPDEVLTLPESSWARGHGPWLNPDTEWMWPLIHTAERTMEGLVEKYPAAEGDLRRLLNQAARELLLLESSDWPFLMSTGQAKDYAIGRFQQHLARFNHLYAIVQRGRIEEADHRFLEIVTELDNPFANLDYRILAARE